MIRHRSLLSTSLAGIVLTVALATAVFAQKTELEVKPAASDEDTTDGKMHPPSPPLTPWISGVFLNPFMMPDFFGGLTFDWRKLVLTAEIPKKSDTLFWFTRNRVIYFKIDGERPTSVQVDQMPWTDLKKPFELDSVPDFATTPKDCRRAMDLFGNLYRNNSVCRDSSERTAFFDDCNELLFVRR